MVKATRCTIKTTIRRG